MIKEEILSQIKPGAKVRVFSTVTAAAPANSKSKGKEVPAAGETTSAFEGLVIARKHGKEAGATFTVRTILAGVGVEKVFPIHSPNISKVAVVSSPKKVHRAKLYFVRKESGKTIRKKLGVSV